MKIENEIEAILNKQLRHEFESAYAYLGLAAALGATAFSGCTHWMLKQYEEELEHARKIFDYMQERQGRVKLQNFEAPNYEICCPYAAFKIAYELEVKNTKNIHNAYALALNKNDYPTQIFLQWFIQEQVEEESNCQKFIDAFELAGENSSSLMTLDQEAGRRK